MREESKVPDVQNGIKMGEGVDLDNNCHTVNDFQNVILKQLISFFANSFALIRKIVLSFIILITALFPFWVLIQMRL